MKIVLSRKGFDSSIQGGGSANIVYNNKCYPIPIPEVGTDIRYSDLKFEDTNYLKVMRDLNINQFTECHLDPFLSRKITPFHPITKNWEKSLGQCDISQNILKENNIKKGDIFLFFGWFNFVKKENGKFKYSQYKKEYHKEGFHLIYGYLEVDKDPVYINENKSIPEWIKTHPHFIHRDYYGGKNAIYTSSKKFSHDQNKPGAGLFLFNEDLILTEKGKTRTNWILPDLFHPDNFTEIKYLPTKNWKKRKNGKTRIKASSRGQEFVIVKDQNDNIKNWAIDLIKKNNVEE